MNVKKNKTIGSINHWYVGGKCFIQTTWLILADVTRKHI